jgi:hypothetical protein
LVDDVPQINNFISSWKEEDIRGITLLDVKEKVEDVLSLLDDIENFLGDPLNAKDKKLENLLEVQGLLRKELRTKLNQGTYNILRDITEIMATNDSMSYHYIQNTSNYSTVIWTRVELPEDNSMLQLSSLKSHMDLDYTNDVGVKLILTPAFGEYPIAVRLLRTDFDHFSDTCRTYFPKALPYYLSLNVLQMAQLRTARLAILSKAKVELYYKSKMKSEAMTRRGLNVKSNTFMVETPESPSSIDFTGYIKQKRKELLPIKHAFDLTNLDITKSRDLEEDRYGFIFRLPDLYPYRKLYVLRLPFRYALFASKPSKWAVTNLIFFRNIGRHLENIKFHCTANPKITSLIESKGFKRPNMDDESMYLLYMLTKGFSSWEPGTRSDRASVLLEFEGELAQKNVKEILEETEEEEAKHLYASLKFTLDQHEVNLREWAIVGPIYYLEFFKRPDQKLYVSTETSVRMRVGDYALEAFPFQAPTRTRSMDEDMTSWTNEHLYRPVTVNLTLAKDVYWHNTPEPVMWDEKSETWSVEGMFDYCKLSENREILSFMISRPGVLGLAMWRIAGLPFIRWELRVDWDSEGVLFAADISALAVEFSVGRGKACLHKVDGTNALDSFLGLYMEPYRFLVTMQRHGLDLFPEFDSFLYVPETKHKNLILETHLYHCMAVLSTTHYFSHSRYITDTFL